MVPTKNGGELLLLMPEVGQKSMMGFVLDVL